MILQNIIFLVMMKLSPWFFFLLIRLKATEITGFKKLLSY